MGVARSAWRSTEGSQNLCPAPWFLGAAYRQRAPARLCPPTLGSQRAGTGTKGALVPLVQPSGGTWLRRRPEEAAGSENAAVGRNLQ